MKKIQLLLACFGSVALLVGCAGPENSDKVAADTAAPTKCQAAEAQTGSMLHSHDCKQNSNLILADPDDVRKLVMSQQPAATMR